MAGRAEEVRRAARELRERGRQEAEAHPAAAPGADALAQANALLAGARAALPESPLVASMRPLGAGCTLAELTTRLAALERAITFV